MDRYQKSWQKPRRRELLLRRVLAVGGFSLVPGSDRPPRPFPTQQGLVSALVAARVAAHAPPGSRHCDKYVAVNHSRQQCADH